MTLTTENITAISAAVVAVLSALAGLVQVWATAKSKVEAAASAKVAEGHAQSAAASVQSVAN